MAAHRILSVGKEPILMASRTLVLRNAGYGVEEAHTVDKALALVEADSIDLTVICHTVPRSEQAVLISFVREKRRLMPILCIRSLAIELPPRTCISVQNEPVALLNAIKLAITPQSPN
jgi:DNA-binding response OmpR family regulator